MSRVVREALGLSDCAQGRQQLLPLDAQPIMASSRSRSPRPENRRRSRSPDRRRDSRPKNSGGFRWKDKKPRDEGYRDDRHRDGDRRLERGYRDQGRPRSPDRNRDRYDNRNRDGDRDRRRAPDETATKGDSKADRKPKTKEKKPPVPQSTEEMIIVHVNDRLGTKAAIPCLASDPISPHPRATPV